MTTCQYRNAPNVSAPAGATATLIVPSPVLQRPAPPETTSPVMKKVLKYLNASVAEREGAASLLELQDGDEQADEEGRPFQPAPRMKDAR